MSDTPTPEEILRVRRHECAISDHTYTEISEVGTGLTQVVCSHCGETWPVVSKEQRVAIAEAQSIVERFAGPYENYGGVNLAECIRILNTIPSTPPPDERFIVAELERKGHVHE